MTTTQETLVIDVPVGQPQPRHVAIIRATIDQHLLADRGGHPECGAVLTFSGTVRNHHLARQVEQLAYEAYAPMALKELNRVVDAMYREQPEVRFAQVVHRFGTMPVGASSIFLTVATPHRPAGFAALRFLIDRIKRDVPIWKKEFYADGETDWLHPEDGCCHHHLTAKPNS
ncbi:molybdenum cofactor biosynthesis protein MoaE [Acanthopleuribacter pedis]|uniref:Molybdopterin synthase catalytic subunit n=1 Tax=Acanthopleuribacter pedis TaxID=442870 RepID=A0A8J7U756_9BACT|nr:molybdenum cofactor biosynthesis protein MoaE [Acanthopleuribacter pedis]MBO1322649.1 molybdenum cofactor biosynthesis protein MoaE [Acanthopleuribacter pedis]